MPISRAKHTTDYSFFLAVVIAWVMVGGLVAGGHTFNFKDAINKQYLRGVRTIVYVQVH